MRQKEMIAFFINKLTCRGFHVTADRSPRHESTRGRATQNGAFRDANCLNRERLFLYAYSSRTSPFPEKVVTLISPSPLP